MLARDLAAYDVVNVGAAGTLVVRKPVSRTKFLAELRRKLPFEAAASFCEALTLFDWKWRILLGLSHSTRMLFVL
jgi:hypothetical protein